MNHTYTISLYSLNTLGVLPRVAMVFSRRRLRIRRLQMSECNTRNLASFQIVFDCQSCKVDQVIRQLKRIIELVDISLDEGNVLTDEPSSIVFAQTAFALRKTG